MSAAARIVEKVVYGAVCLFVLYKACIEAHDIRLYAIKDYGLVIHEFDPWFNFRATQYLADHGLYEFFHWFDHRSWYPLGRPVGTTIYPGMQMVAVAIWRTMNEYVGYEMSLNDVCVYMPTWFGVSATIFLGLLTWECSGSAASGAFASAIFAVIPAHIMRSVGGGFDNESVAITSMLSTFYFWVRALRYDPKCKNGEATWDSCIFGVLAGISYVWMVANWGGFIFVLNMVGAHAALLAVAQRYTSKLHRAFSLFYFIGTVGAIQIPVVGWAPLRSLEQLAPCVVFLGFQLLEYCEIQRRKRNLNLIQLYQLRVKVFTPVVLVAALGVAQLTNMGYFGPLSARVRGLFVKHTRTGNPLVDSVAEHQPASAQAYKQYLQNVFTLVPVGFVISLLRWYDGNSFILAYGVVAYYFANRMARLIVLIGPVASAFGGIAFGFAFDQLIVAPVFKMLRAVLDSEEPEKKEEEPAESKVTSPSPKSKKSKSKGKKAGKKSAAKESNTSVVKSLQNLKTAGLNFYNLKVILLARLGIGLALISFLVPFGREFYDYSQQMAKRMSHPSIMFKAQLRNGQEIIVDDYREGYWWLRDNTPDDSRVLSWWDYGYQISGIANRTTLADGNTWNHEHIATIGRILTAPEKEAHKLARHLADYVLVWTGGGGDDLAKSPHMARIGNSVYPGLCPDDPTCSHFGFYSREPLMPTPSMKKSLLYKLSVFGLPDQKDVTVDKSLFKHVFTSKYGKMRIFKIMSVSKKSKKWLADPANRKCDRPGSWYCVGQYPPALKDFIASRVDFAQLEDFNKAKDEKSKKYTEEYMARMEGRKTGRSKSKGPKDGAKLKFVGCYGNEDDLGSDRVYAGGASGAQVQLLFNLAQEKKMKYFAIARVGDDGYSFVFNEPPKKKAKTYKDDGCKKPCADTADFFCGCADGACGDLKPGKGSSDLRRWIVYKYAGVDKA